MMNGSQESPSVTTTAYGVGVFNLSKDLSKIKFNIVTQGLNGTSTGAHLHYGGVGMSGGVSVDLSSNINGNVISGTIMNPTTTLIDSLMAGKIYLNVHNAANPNGEIRGQLMNSKSYLYFDAALNGAQETPAITTSALGAATYQIQHHH